MSKLGWGIKNHYRIGCPLLCSYRNNITEISQEFKINKEDLLIMLKNQPKLFLERL